MGLDLLLGNGQGVACTKKLKRSNAYATPANLILNKKPPSLSRTMHTFIQYVNKFPLTTDIRKSGALSILHGTKRPLYPNRKKPYKYMERPVRIGDRYCIKDVEGKLYDIEAFIKEESLKPVKNFIDNILLPSYGQPVKYTILRTADEVEQALKSFLALGRPISMDIETSGLDPYTSVICGIGMTSSASGGVYIPLAHYPDVTHRMLIDNDEDNNYALPDKAKTTKLIQEYMGKIPFVGHNMKFEYKMFKVNYNVDIQIEHCTMLGEYIIDERLKYRYNLGASVKERFPEIPTWKESKEFLKMILYLPPSKVGRYCVRDCAYTYLLYLNQLAYIHKYVKRLYYEIDLPYTKCAADAELHGFELDEQYIETLSNELLNLKNNAEAEIKKLAGADFDVASPQQLQKVLFDKMGFEVIKTTKTGRSTDKRTLEKLRDKTNHPIFQQILDFRLYSKLQSTYTTAYLEQKNKVTGRLHPSFMLTTTVTGRISCTDPNLQNIPKNASSLIRKMFLAPKGHVLIFSDYSGQETRILAALSRDLNLIRAYNPCFKCDRVANCPKNQGVATKDLPPECHEQDLHSMVAKILYPDIIKDTPVWEIKENKDKKIKRCRSLSKAITFALCYGSSAIGIADTTGMTVEEAEALQNLYFQKFPNVKKAIREAHESAVNNGYVIDLAGRYRHMTKLAIPHSKDNPNSPFYKKPYLDDEGWVKGVKKGMYGGISSELRQAQNFPMQGTAASMTKEASVCLRRRFKEMKHRPQLVGFIHD